MLRRISMKARGSRRIMGIGKRLQRYLSRPQPMESSPKRIYGNEIMTSHNFNRKMSSASTLNSEERVVGMQKILEDFGAEFINIEDTSGGCGAFFHIHIVSSKFEGMALVKRQREVQKMLHEFIHDVHGTSIKPVTVPEHEAKIVDILHYQWEFHRFCVENKISFLVEEEENEMEIAQDILQSGILPDGKPLFWENDKDYWDTAEEMHEEDLFRRT